MKSDLILAIDTGSYQSSITVLNLKNKNSISKLLINKKTVSEIFVDEIADFLKTNLFRKEDISLIVISEGPGNFTGLRLGAALAKGLSVSINSKLLGYSAFDGETIKNIDGKFLCLAIGINMYVWKKFPSGSEKDKENFLKGNLIELIENLEKNIDREVVVDSYTYSQITLSAGFQFRSINQTEQKNKLSIIKLSHPISQYLAERVSAELAKYKEFSKEDFALDLIY